ncbi:MULTISPECIES: hypothetical protein [Streptomyces]|uniref:hypothetical protein n=1 Tax=Streptomyces TaxID=1883 RepID=UPI00163BE007|nr:MULTISPECIES: hypothetical protein [Streptomyces]MBC2874169.1 hypothetical protein [Streptomyces sp. TYQ1024]UBI40217.1 hypothetical protein K7I03_29695 [Streptomyces mobaraensis]UKW32795.1 hypothetical protein MCU78_29620 [Streptomyces sp. TYQ1024]
MATDPVSDAIDAAASVPKETIQALKGNPETSRLADDLVHISKFTSHPAHASHNWGSGRMTPDRINAPEED